jgi:large subunit ribosomal protein L31
MKKDIHPKYSTDTKVICACGNEFPTGSVLGEIKTELCSACHPFYTGKQKLVDSSRRVEKFHGKLKAKDEMTVVKKGKTAKRAAKANKKEAEKKTEDK